MDDKEIERKRLNEEERQKALSQPLEDMILDLKADYEERLAANGIKFSQGLNAINMGDLPDTKENRAKVALGWIAAMISMDHPKESDSSTEEL